MESIDENVQSNFELQITHSIKESVLSTAKWGKFLAVVGMVFCGLLVVLALLMIAMGGSVGRGQPAMMIGIMYIFMAIIYFFPCLYLLHYSNKAKAGIEQASQSELNEAFVNLDKMFKFVGVLTIIVLALYAILLLFGLMAGASRF